LIATPRACREYESVPAAAVPAFRRLLGKIAANSANVKVKKIQDGRIPPSYGVRALYSARATIRGRMFFSLDGNTVTIHGFADRGDKRCYRGEK
jgi:hypothetical protein